MNGICGELDLFIFSINIYNFNSTHANVLKKLFIIIKKKTILNCARIFDSDVHTILRRVSELCVIYAKFVASINVCKAIKKIIGLLLQACAPKGGR